MIRIVYSVLFTLLLPVLVLRMLLRSRRAPAYRRRLGERFGLFTLPADSRPCIWIHAVSLGETLAARPLIERMLAELPRYRLLVSTTTPTGSAQVTQLFGDRVQHVYAPWDTPGAVKRFLRRVQPQLLVLMETELWPNMLHYSQRAGCRVLLANARLSARSAAGYARFERSTQRMLHALDWVAAQSSADADRFVQLGMNPSRIAVSGSIKFDIRLTDEMHEQAARWRREWGLEDRGALIVASTHDGEDALALGALTTLREAGSDALLILAPRHPERFEVVYRQCVAAGWRVARRSQGAATDDSTDILLVDSLGELLQLFGVADVAVIGGSFIPRGGHNPLEAAAWGIPVLSGQSVFNFADVSQRLIEAEALECVQDGAALNERVLGLLGDESERQRRGAAALEVMAANRGALDSLFTALCGLLDHR